MCFCIIFAIFAWHLQENGVFIENISSVANKIIIYYCTLKGDLLKGKYNIWLYK